MKPRKKKFPVSFRKRRLLESALFHPSYRNEHPPFALENFDRLEFFGDSLLNFVVCRKLYALYPKADEGLLSRLRSILVSRKILSRIAGELKLGQFVRLGENLLKQGEFSEPKILADSLEAVIGALYFDQGFAKTEKFILKNFRGFFDAKRLFRLDPNPKSTLQELAQRQWQRLPIYASEAAAQGAKTVVRINRTLRSTALGKNRKESEEKAARLLIRKIRQELLRRSKKRSSARK